MKWFGLLSDFYNSAVEKCDVCVEVKSIKKTCKYVERETELLSLIHIDLDILSKLWQKVEKGIMWPLLMIILYIKVVSLEP